MSLWLRVLLFVGAQGLGCEQKPSEQHYPEGPPTHRPVPRSPVHHGNLMQLPSATWQGAFGTIKVEGETIDIDMADCEFARVSAIELAPVDVKRCPRITVRSRFSVAPEQPYVLVLGDPPRELIGFVTKFGTLHLGKPRGEPPPQMARAIFDGAATASGVVRVTTNAWLSLTMSERCIITSDEGKFDAPCRIDKAAERPALIWDHCEGPMCADRKGERGLVYLTDLVELDAGLDALLVSPMTLAMAFERQ